MSDREHDPKFEAPPEDATCREHPDRLALVMCPECKKPACIACWHHPIRRCHTCLMMDPEGAAPPLAWEARDRPVLSRFFATLSAALRPLSSAPSFAREGAVGARSFFLLSFVPLALLSAIVPFTHTLLFGPTFAIQVIGDADGRAIAIDLARALAIGFVSASAQLAALAFPYISLARAYGAGGPKAAPVRVVLYRAFLLPLGDVLFSLFLWSAPSGGNLAAVEAFARIVQVIPLILLFLALRATARMASGTGPMASLVVTVVPFAALVIVQGWLLEGLRDFAPDPVAIEARASE